MDEPSQDRVMPLLPTAGRGKELMEMLRRELNVPAHARTFEVRFALNEPVSVRVEYVAREQRP